MTTNKDYILREIAGQAFLIPTGKESEKLNGMIELTSTGAFIWKHADEAESCSEIISMMMEEYEVEEEVVKQDVLAFMTELALRGMISKVPDLTIKLPDGKLGKV